MLWSLFMPSLNTIIIFTAAAFAVTAIPGPSMLYVMSRSIGQGRVAGILSALGLATGLFIHTLAASFGLSIVYIRLHLDDNRPFCGSFDRNNGKYNIPMADKKTANP